MKLAGAALIGLLLLGGCGPSPGGGSPEGQCQRIATNDPEVEKLRVREGTLDASASNRESLAIAEKQAYLRCMRLRGLAPPGGVEAVRRR